MIQKKLGTAYPPSEPHTRLKLFWGVFHSSISFICILLVKLFKHVKSSTDLWMILMASIWQPIHLKKKKNLHMKLKVWCSCSEIFHLWSIYMQYQYETDLECSEGPHAKNILHVVESVLLKISYWSSVTSFFLRGIWYSDDEPTGLTAVAHLQAGIKYS